ncbi:unnamed protein product, partial [Rangifer tarandus platyrhynchus]
RLIGNPDPRRGGQEGGQRGSEAGPSRPPAPPEVREIRNNDSRPPGGGRKPRCCLISAPVPSPSSQSWFSREDLEGGFCADGQPHHLKKVNLVNDMQVLQDRVITENHQRTPSADVLNISDYSN